jgi:cysteinyl-tRNA synthetase
MAVVVTEKNLLDLKQNLVNAKYTMVQAEATYTELLKTLDVQKEDLKQFGIENIEDIDSFVQKLQDEIAEGYAKYSILYEEVRSILSV